MPQPHSGAHASSSDQHRKEKRADLIFKVRFNNTLPDIPFEPKYLDYPIDAQRFVQYTVTSLEKDHKHELYGEFDGGLSVELIGLDADAKCAPPASGKPDDPLDQLLLEDDDESAKLKEAAARSTRHRGTVSWLRKTEYVSAENVNRSILADKVESRVGYGMKRVVGDDEILYRDRDSQIAAIRRTFERVKEPITQHYSKPGIEPVEILPVLPDFAMWPYACAQVIFDSDPSRNVASKDKPSTSGADTVEKPEEGIAQPQETARHVARRQFNEMSTAMIRGMMDEQGEQFVGYFLPNDSTRRRLVHRRRTKRRALYGDARPVRRESLKRRSTSVSNADDVDVQAFESETDEEAEDEQTEDTEVGEVNEYVLAREYNWTVKNRATRGYEENYFFVFTPQNVMYLDIDTKVRLSKRRRLAAGPNEQPFSAVQLERQRARTRLLVTTREETEEEKQLGVSRTRRMFGLPDEDEEEEEEDANEAVPERADAGGETPRHDSGSEKQDSDDEDPRPAADSDAEPHGSDSAPQSPKAAVDSDADSEPQVNLRREPSSKAREDDSISLSLSSSSSSLSTPLRDAGKRKAETSTSKKKQPAARQRSRNTKTKKPSAKKRRSGSGDSVSSSSLSLSESD